MEIATGIHSLRQTMGGRVHAFLLDDGEGLTLIDTLYDTDGHRVLEAIRGLGRAPQDLRRIVLTHGHRSHLGGLAALKRASGATVYAHEWEEDIISGDRKAQAVTIVPMRPLRTYARVYPLQLGLALGVGRHPPCAVDEAIEDGSRVGPLEVIHAPGHSPGHLAFWWPERRALFAGDAIATWPELAAGWPAFNLNERQHRATIGRLAELDAEIVAVGHGEPIREDAARAVQHLATSMPR
jgi:glyoxylase-like metal-dependent hydrolase (beta-lactamase superfamily II)